MSNFGSSYPGSSDAGPDQRGGGGGGDATARTATILSLAIALLVGCAAPVDPAEQAAVDDAACISYGFEARTDGYAACRLQLARDHAQAEDARRERIREGFRRAGESMSRPVGGTTCVQTGNILSCN